MAKTNLKNINIPESKAETLKKEIEKDKMERAQKCLDFLNKNRCEIKVTAIFEEGKAPTFRKVIFALD